MAAINSVHTHHQRAFTLLELLVVITIIGVIAGAVVVSLSGGSSTRQLRAEAERLQQALQLAADEAIFQKGYRGAVLSAHGYRFVQFDAATRTWQPLNEPPFAEYTLPDTITLSLASNAKEVALPDDTSAVSRKPQPSLLFLSTGEMTAFTLSLSSAAMVMTVVADGISPIALEQGHPPEAP